MDSKGVGRMKKINQILVALDLGQDTENLVRKTSWLAKKCAAEVIPVHAVEIGNLYSNSPVVDMEQIYKQINSQFKEVKRSLVNSGVLVREILIKNGDPKKEILEIGENLNVDLLILGVHQKNMLERLMGSTAEHIIRNAAKPVLCVHPHDSLGTIEKVVCALDGSKSSTNTLNEAINFCHLVKAKLQILHVVPYAKYYPNLGELRSPISEWGHDLIPDVVAEHRFIDSKIEEQEKHDFKKFLQNFDMSGLNHSHCVSRGEASEQITEFVMKEGCDLLLMGAADGKEKTTFFTRGTIEKVLRKVPCSVLTIKHLINQKSKIKPSKVEAVP